MAAAADCHALPEAKSRSERCWADCWKIKAFFKRARTLGPGEILELPCQVRPKTGHGCGQAMGTGRGAGARCPYDNLPVVAPGVKRLKPSDGRACPLPDFRRGFGKSSDLRRVLYAVLPDGQCCPAGPEKHSDGRCSVSHRANDGKLTQDVRGQPCLRIEFYRGRVPPWCVCRLFGAWDVPPSFKLPTHFVGKAYFFRLIPPCAHGLFRGESAIDGAYLCLTKSSYLKRGARVQPLRPWFGQTWHSRLL